MLDIRLIRERPQWVREQLARLHDEDALPRLGRVIQLDARRRQALSEAEGLQAWRNRLNRAGGQLRAQHSRVRQERAPNSLTQRAWLAQIWRKLKTRLSPSRRICWTRRSPSCKRRRASACLSSKVAKPIRWR